jgi:hypothetical protein
VLGSSARRVIFPCMPTAKRPRRGVRSGGAGRDEFTPLTKNIVAQRAGLLCSFPDCRKSTKGPSLFAPDKDVNAGCASHICAAAKRGPRFDPAQPTAERKSAANGIWLCRNHGEIVDADHDTYPAVLLREWKAKAESFVAAQRQ